MQDGSLRTIGEVARLADVSIRTLRYYDQIGLLQPGGHSAAGYRLYGDADLARLEEILTWRRLGLPLLEISLVMNGTDEEREQSLARHRHELGGRLMTLRSMSHELHQFLNASEAGDSGKPIGNGPDTPAFSVERVVRIDGPRRLRQRRQRLTRGEIPRIVCTDPIELGESLLALGLVPVGVGTSRNRFTNKLGSWPWPPLIEAPVRNRIRDLGLLGANPRLIEGTAPDLIFDIYDTERRMTVVEAVTRGRYGYDDLASIAPTVLVDGFTRSADAVLRPLHRIAGTLGLAGRAEELEAIWQARTRTLGGHVQGAAVSVLFVVRGRCHLPSAPLARTLFGGISVNVMPSIETRFPSWVEATREQLAELSAPVLFITSRFTSRTQLQAILDKPPLRDLPAVAARRIYDTGFGIEPAGWFSAHWQLHTLARAFGVTQLRSDDSRLGLFGAVSPNTGLSTWTTVRPSKLQVAAGSPFSSPSTLDIREGQVTKRRLPPNVLERLADLPETFELSVEGTSAGVLAHDRESASRRAVEALAPASNE
jgi:DNA-binding transcriptional MerR regulator/ABC-type Fe3+-hydroxamate transport system substrate-binding protein